jgi:hypothetical protein
LFGEVAEWSIASDLKSDDAAMYPEVRILSSPFFNCVSGASLTRSLWFLQRDNPDVKMRFVTMGGFVRPFPRMGTIKEEMGQFSSECYILGKEVSYEHEVANVSGARANS